MLFYRKIALVTRGLDEEPILNEAFLMQQINGLCVTTGSQLSAIPENWERQKYAGLKRKRNFTVKFIDSNKKFYVVFNNFSKKNTTQNGPVGTQQIYGGLNAGRGTKRKIGPTTINNDKGRRSMTIIITDDDVKRVLPMADCIDAMRIAFKDFSEGSAVNLPRSRYEGSNPSRPTTTSFRLTARKDE